MAQPDSSALTDPQARLSPHQPLTRFYESAEQRPGFVRALFDTTAPSYDRVSWLLGGGTDRRYRREALVRAGLRPGMRLLDVASGTGLVLRAALSAGVAASDITGLDPSHGMLQENRKHSAAPLVQGVGERLPFADQSFDFISMGYALRHVEDINAFFRELLRVLKPRGRLLVLEIARPRSKIVARLIRWHLVGVIPFLAGFFNQRTQAKQLMDYYWATIENCVPPAQILAALAGAGFCEVNQHLSGGFLSDYSAGKP